MSEYETHLTTLSLDDLLAEPTALQTQAHHVTSSLTSLTHTSYPTFLSLHDSTTALSTSLTHLSTSLSSLITSSLPALHKTAEVWNTRTTDILHERSKARLVLDQHDKLKDLLDIPIFIESCVRNGYFQEALALSAHVAVLATKPDAPPILTSIHAEVKAAIAQMLVVLLGTLHEPGRKLPAFWKAVNFLRKMDAFGQPEQEEHGYITKDGAMATTPVSSEELLALAFLSGRLACLATSLDPISRDIHRLISHNPKPDEQTQTQDVDTVFTHGIEMSNRDKEDVARYLKKYIDTWREGAYDILTQYSTIFLEQHSQQPHPPLPKQSPRHPSQTDLPTPHQPSLSFLPFLSPHLLSHLLPLLRTALPLLSLSLLPSLLTQLTYCATAFARVGLDFRSIIGHLITRAVADAVRRGFHDAPSVMSMSTNKAKGKATKQVDGTVKPSEWLVLPSLVDAPPLPYAHPHGPAHIPPQILASYPPLARHANALLGVLNALRLLAPVEIASEVLSELEGVFRRDGGVFGHYLRGFLGRGEDGDDDGGVEGRHEEEEREEREGEGRKEERIARAAGDVYFRVLVPFMRRALVEGVYGVQIGELGEVDGAVREWEEMRE